LDKICLRSNEIELKGTKRLRKSATRVLFH